MPAARRNSSELLCVDVNQLARMLPDVADRNTGDAVMVAQATGAMAVKNLVDGRPRHAESEGQPVRSVPQLPPGYQNAIDLVLWKSTGAASRSGGAVL